MTLEDIRTLQRNSSDDESIFPFLFLPPSFLFDSKILSLLPETLNSFLLNHAFPITRNENIENINPLIMKIFSSSHYFISQAKSLPRRVLLASLKISQRKSCPAHLPTPPSFQPCVQQSSFPCLA